MDAIGKQRAKQLVRRVIGEPYVGKRIKLRRLAPTLRALELQPAAILDAGAEDATFVYWLADRYRAARVVAVDIDAGAVAACVAVRPVAYAGRVCFEAAPFDALPSHTYDLITAFDVLEHIADDAGAAAQLVRALRPGGTLLVHVPRERWLTRDGTVHRVDDAHAWQINAGHVRQGYSPAALRRLITTAGAQVQDVQTWVGRWGTLAHSVYARLEHPAALRALTIPVTDVCAWLDARRPTSDGNTVFLRATAPR